MKIQYCSDLHLEFPENKSFINKRPLQPEGEILLLGGDILPFVLNHRNYAFFDFVADNFEVVYWIPGNHEYYGFDIRINSDPVYEKIRSNVFLVNNYNICRRDISIVCSTLWSVIQPKHQQVVQRGLSDFYAIQVSGGAFLPKHFNELHQHAFSFIKQEVAATTASKIIVLSHHVPTFFNYPPKYRKSVLNEAFAVELGNYIEGSNISHWIYGHHHSNIPPFKIGNTMMLTNQLGYIRNYEHGGFRRNAVFEI